MKPMARSMGGIDWPAVRDMLGMIDLESLATRLLGPAPGRRGGRVRRTWWRSGARHRPTVR
jgi:hypothetical protein